MNYLRKNIDRLSGYAVFWLILVYVLVYGIVNLGSGQHFTLTTSYLIILLPIWLIDGMKGLLETVVTHDYFRSKEDLSKVTVVIACKDGEGVIGKTLVDLVARFDKQNIIVVSNGSSDKTCEVARSYGVKVLDIKEPLGKVRAINRALSIVSTPYVLLLDDDTLIGDASIPTGLIDDGYDAVAFRVLVTESSWVTKIQSYEYVKSTDIGKKHYNRSAAVQNISGAIGLFSLKHLKRQIKRHTGEFSGEDLQRTLLIHLSQGAKGIIVAQSIVYTQPPVTLKELYDQRIFGWFPGLYANFSNYLKILTRDKMPYQLRLDAFYNCFLVMVMDILRLLSLPIIFFFPGYFVLMYATYLLLESVQFFKLLKRPPIWVLLIYPFYGIFGFITRIGAFATFLYRRLNIKFSKRDFLDDYRTVPNSRKSLSMLLTLSLFVIVLASNIYFNYVTLLLNIHF